jgi:hypothetical protein
MKQVLKSAFLILVAAVVFGCATQVPVEILKPSEVNMASMKKIAIFNFGYPSLGYSDVTAETLIRDAIGRYMGYSYHRDTLQESVAKHATDTFVSLLMDTEYFTLIDGSSIQSAIVKANKLSLTPAELGELLGVDALISGYITLMDSDVTDRVVQDKDKTGKVIKSTVWYDKLVTLELNYKITNTKTGALVAAKKFSGEAKDSKTDYYELADDQQLYNQVINNILHNVPKQLVPYKVVEYRPLMADETKDPNMEKINELVNKKFYDDAYSEYLGIWKSNKNPAAGYNAAIMLEITGDIDGAIALMTEVANKSKNEKALREISRLKKTKADSEAANDQM